MKKADVWLINVILSSSPTFESFIRPLVQYSRASDVVPSR